MEKVSISKLKDQLSAYLQKVRHGQTLVVMDRSTPVARLVPIAARESEDERITRLVAQGVVRLPKGTRLDLKEFMKRRPVIENAGVLEALLAERREET